MDIFSFQLPRKELLAWLTSFAGPHYVLGLLGVFLGVCLLCSGLYHLVFNPLFRERYVQRRLARTKKDRLAEIQILKEAQEAGGSLILLVVQKLGALRKIENLQKMLLQADIYWHPATFLSVAGLLACMGFLLAFVRMGIYPALAAALLGGAFPFLLARYRRARKTKIIEKQMPETMELLARSLRAGHALPSAIDLASKEIPNPLGGELKIVYEEQRLGLGLNAALRRLGERVASQDLQYFITAVLLQSETGGNLAEIMENIGYLIRERLKLKGKVQALTAEGRFSAVILTLLPFIVFAILTMLNRNYIYTLFKEPVGYKLMAVGLGNILLGILWMKKIIKIDV